MTRIHELRHRVTLLRRRVTEEEDGSFAEYWQEGDPVWARVVPCPVRETARGTGEGWNHFPAIPLKYKVTMRVHQGRFERVRVSFREGEDITLAMLCPPVVDPRRQWMSCIMYELGENNE